MSLNVSLKSPGVHRNQRKDVTEVEWTVIVSVLGLQLCHVYTSRHNEVQCARLNTVVVVSVPRLNKVEVSVGGWLGHTS